MTGITMTALLVESQASPPGWTGETPAAPPHNRC